MIKQGLKLNIDIMLRIERIIRTEVYTSKVNGSVNGGYTVGDFKITEVIKNEVDNVKINLENPIPVAELNFESEGTIYSVNGYEKMNQNFVQQTGHIVE